MRILTALLVLMAGTCWTAGTARGQVPRIPVFRPPPPPIRVGPHIPHVPVPHVATGGGAHGGGRQVLDDGVIFVVTGVVVLLGVVYFVWKRNRPVATVASAAALPPDWVHPPEEVADRARETERLLEGLSAQDARVAPSAFRDLVWTTFMQAQRCWEAREYGPMQDLLTPELYAAHTAAVGSMRKLHLINQLVGMTIERLELAHVCWPAGDERQEVAALVTFRAISDYLSDRVGGAPNNSSEATRFQEFWVFRRQGGSWKLAAIEMTRESTRLEEANDIAPLVGTGDLAI